MINLCETARAVLIKCKTTNHSLLLYCIRVGRILLYLIGPAADKAESRFNCSIYKPNLYEHHTCADRHKHDHYDVLILPIRRTWKLGGVNRHCIKVIGKLRRNSHFPPRPTIQLRLITRRMLIHPFNAQNFLSKYAGYNGWARDGSAAKTLNLPRGSI